MKKTKINPLRKSDGAVIVGVLVAATFIGIVVSTMLQSTRGQGVFSQGYTTVFNAQMAVSNGIAATESFFGNDANGDSIIAKINLVDPPAGGSPEPQFVLGGEKEAQKLKLDNNQKFSSQFISLTPDTIAEFKVISQRGLRVATAYYKMTNLRREVTYTNAAGRFKNGMYFAGGLSDGNNGADAQAGNITINGQRTRFQNNQVNTDSTATSYFGEGFIIPGGRDVRFGSHVYSGCKNGPPCPTTTMARSEIDGASGVVFGGDVWFDNEFFVAGDGNPIRFEGKSYFRENVTIPRNAVFIGDAYFDKNVTIAGADFRGKVFVGEAATFTGTNSFRGDAYFRRTLTASNATFDARLTTASDATLTGNGHIHGITYIGGKLHSNINSAGLGNIFNYNGKLTVMGDSAVFGGRGNHINNDAYFAGTLRTAGGSFGGDLGTGKLHVARNTILASDLVVFNGDAYLGGTLTTASGQASASGIFKSGVYVHGVTNLANANNRFDGETYFNNNLTIRGNTAATTPVFEGKVYVEGDTEISGGVVAFRGDAYLKGSFTSAVRDVFGNVSFGAGDFASGKRVFIGGDMTNCAQAVFSPTPTCAPVTTHFRGLTVVDRNLTSGISNNLLGVQFYDNVRINGDMSISNIIQYPTIATTSNTLFGSRARVSGNINLEGNATAPGSMWPTPAIVAAFDINLGGTVTPPNARLAFKNDPTLGVSAMTFRHNNNIGTWCATLSPCTNLPVLGATPPKNITPTFQNPLSEVIAPANYLPANHITPIPALPAPDHVTPIAYSVARPDSVPVHKVPLEEDEPFCDATILALTTATRPGSSVRIAVDHSAVVPVSGGNNISLARLKAAYDAAAAENRLYKGHLVVHIGTNKLLNFQSVSGEFEDKVMFIVTGGGTIYSGSRFYRSGRGSNTVIYVANGGSLRNFGSDEFFRGYVHIAAGGIFDLMWGSGKCFEGAIHSFSTGGTSWNISTTANQPLKIYFNEALLNPFEDLLTCGIPLTFAGATPAIPSRIPVCNQDCFPRSPDEQLACDSGIDPTPPPPATSTGIPGEWKFGPLGEYVPMNLIGVYYGK